jgi:membrane-associated protease RseP (regulator of RpoE activity)
MYYLGQYFSYCLLEVPGGLIGFLGFAIAVYNKTLERKPLIPVFIFLGGLIIRFAIGIIFPLVLKSRDYVSLGISLLLLIILIIFGMRVKKGRI